MSKHTPGPFAARGNEVYELVDAPKGSNVSKLTYRMLARCGQDWHQANYNEAEANARLFAASPDLLGYVKEQLSNLEHGLETGAWDQPHYHILERDRLRALITKAEGETTT